MIVLTCLDGEKTLVQDPCPMGQSIQYTEAVLLTQAEYEAYQAMSGPVDVALAAKIFFFFFSSSIFLWVIGKVLGTVIKFTREA
jgi:hypothetical protein